MKILVLTSVYPQPEDEKEDGVTPVVHYFAKEWVKSGHEVLVIHNSNKFISFLYLLPKFIKRKINSLLGMAIPRFSQRAPLFRKSEGVKIKRIPIFKFIPRMDFLYIQIKRQYNKIIKVLENEGFAPDLILGHWEAPQIQLVSMLKDKYNCKSAVVFHGVSYLNKKSYFTRNKKYIDNIDVVGGRSEAISNELKKLLNLQYEPFVCYSGIPDEYMANLDLNGIHQKFDNKMLTNFLYVGRLIDRKNVESIIKSLNHVYREDKFTFDIIGTGANEKSLKKLTKSLSLESKVQFHGIFARETVIDYMRNAQCFTMISENEVFGLVYLEAMALGCIVIASKNEGFSEIIVDGVNGFLCKAGDTKELAMIYSKINNLSSEEKRIISKNAINTAFNFKESKIAKKYLDSVIEK